MVKTILDRKSGKVMPWAAIQTAAYSLLDTPVDFDREGHRYTLNGRSLESVTQILQAEGFIDTTFYDDFSRERGALVHLACHYDDTKELDDDSLDEVIVPYVAAWRSFKAESGFIVERSEVPMASKAYLYAGTPDVIGYFPAGFVPRGAVELHKDGTYKLIPYKDRQDVALWQSILAVHNWKANLKRRAA